MENSLAAPGRANSCGARPTIHSNLAHRLHNLAVRRLPAVSLEPVAGSGFLFWCLARRGIRGSFIDFRRRNFLLVVHGEEHVIAEAMTPMDSPSPPIVVNVRAFWQPHVHVAFGEMYRAILDVRAIL